MESSDSMPGPPPRLSLIPCRRKPLKIPPYSHLNGATQFPVYDPATGLRPSNKASSPPLMRPQLGDLLQWAVPPGRQGGRHGGFTYSPTASLFQD